jgi:uncharacterized surface protein with fasciclin (FAS1) repeats
MDPVAVAASNSPLLTKFSEAVSGKLNTQVNLFDVLNDGQFTVFAPTDAAFGKIDETAIEMLKTDDALLAAILTYHVVVGRVGPDQIVGTHETVQGGELAVSGSGGSLYANTANVVCGGIATRNATVYLIDGVLMPPAAPAPTP